MGAMAVTQNSDVAPSHWRYDRRSHLARLDCGDWRGEVDLARADRGLILSHVAAGGSSLQLFQLDERNLAGSPPADAYVRGADLFAAYDSREDRPVGVSAYWRVELAEDWLICHHIVSLQTPLLETYPDVVVRSSFPYARFRSLGQSDWRSELDSAASIARGTLVADLDGASVLLLAPSPTDHRDCVIEMDPAAQCARVTHQLVAGFLEKGVIRRYRLMAAIGRDASERMLNELYERFVAGPLPLTT
jgi:hypothetical protein